MDKQYIAIDLKSFYASVEAVDRKLDPLMTNLVVADPTRTEKTICLAVSPSLKAYGISGRARLFEVVQKVKEINIMRLNRAIKLGVAIRDDSGKYSFSGSSCDARELEKDPSLELAYITAPPRMAKYEEVSTRVYSTYMNYVSPEDIHVYSIDECFIDVSAYLHTYSLTAHELAKVAMDIVAKHARADEQGVRIAELNEMSYRELLWCHRPLTDFWRVGRGISRRLESMQCYTMGDVARLSVQDEDRLYKEFGINAELLIDHAWGWEPTDIATIKSYKPENNSISSGQVLMEPYNAEKGRLIVKEMTELLVLDLVRKNLVTRQVVLTIGYDRESLKVLHQGRTAKDTVYAVAATGKRYTGAVTADFYGRLVPKHAHGTGNLERYTSSTRKIMEVMTQLYDSIIDPDLLIRRVNVVAAGVIPESEIPPEEPEQMDLFTDYKKRDMERAEEKKADEKEKRMQKATLLLQEKFGKNAVLKGMNLNEGATTIQRNGQIGGHKAE